MKSYITLIAIFFLSSGLLFSQANKGPVIGVDREVHDFGTMRPDQIPDGKLSFTVYNQGDEPLIISGVRACCGTRVDDYTKTPIAAGDSGMVAVSWRIHNQPHRINRTVNISSNARNRELYIIRIRGEVVRQDD